jgi:hypothetical protein
VTSRRARWVGVSVATILVLTLVLAIVPFLFPRSDLPFEQGPVVALGGNPARAVTAADIVEDPAARRPLLLSAWQETDSRATGLRCQAEGITCVDPVPVITYGEARVVGELARQHGWTQVTVVTSEHHVTRSRLLFERCVDVPVAVLAGPRDEHRWPARILRAFRELTSASVSFLVHRDC